MVRKSTKFRAICECGKKQPRFTSDWTAYYWMRAHEREHEAAEAKECSR